MHKLRSTQQEKLEKTMSKFQTANKQSQRERERERERDWDLHRVFYCVRGDDIGIVAFGESGEHFGNEGDGDVPFHQVVRLAVNFASPQASHSYARLAMLMLQLLLRHRLQNYTTKGTKSKPPKKNEKTPLTMAQPFLMVMPFGNFKRN